MGVPVVNVRSNIPLNIKFDSTSILHLIKQNILRVSHLSDHLTQYWCIKLKKNVSFFCPYLTLNSGRYCWCLLHNLLQGGFTCHPLMVFFVATLKIKIFSKHEYTRVNSPLLFKVIIRCCCCAFYLCNWILLPVCASRLT